MDKGDGEGREGVPIIVMTLLFLLSAVRVDFFTDRPGVGFVKTCCMIVPWPGSAFGCRTWLTNGCGRRTFEPERGRPCASSG